MSGPEERDPEDPTKPDTEPATRGPVTPSESSDPRTTTLAVPGTGSGDPQAARDAATGGAPSEDPSGGSSRFDSGGPTSPPADSEPRGDGGGSVASRSTGGSEGRTPPGPQQPQTSYGRPTVGVTPAPSSAATHIQPVVAAGGPPHRAAQEQAWSADTAARAAAGPRQATAGDAGTSGAGPAQPGASEQRVRVTTTRPAERGTTGPRRARLVLTRLDPWSVLKFSLLLSVCLLVVLVVAVLALYSVLDAAGVFDSINATLESVSPSLSADRYLGLSRVLGATVFLGAVNVVLITALATLGAFLYNLCAGLVGGLEVTLTESD